MDHFAFDNLDCKKIFFAHSNKNEKKRSDKKFVQKSVSEEF